MAEYTCGSSVAFERPNDLTLHLQPQPTHPIPFGFLVLFEKPNRSSFTFYTYIYPPGPSPIHPSPRPGVRQTLPGAPPNTLPVPQHVSLNHLNCTTINDNLMVQSVTQRFAHHPCDEGRASCVHASP